MGAFLSSAGAKGTMRFIQFEVPFLPSLFILHLLIMLDILDTCQNLFLLWPEGMRETMAFGDVKSRIRTKETDGTDNGLLDSSGQTPQERVCLSCLRLHQLVSSTTYPNVMAATSARTPQANETVVVHCGFYSEHGGFRIFNEDKSHMHIALYLHMHLVVGMISTSRLG
ncbi:uncharacterized protein M6B38_353675 [Iris pallida]|uniref:Uncharacterized protein n=1 Tax=Iris pallida TaxID=29817 RepID=A0AAX6GPS8_IRIPA|nr:uncharacterized protein M6B38_353675 [Iris pallida]